ncbi:hypothetical protein C8J56DRAFT_1089034 [Mycena floridula]|nr:hypothetical protein C8J56DRAFT_1089034 [Mycena floridula]
MLLTGTTFQALETFWAEDIPNLQNALQPLLEVALLERTTTTYFVLPVIRSHVLDTEHIPSTVWDSMRKAACYFLRKHSCTTPGEPSYKDDLVARSAEEINLQTVLLDTPSPEPHFLEALLTLAEHQCQIQPRTQVIEHAVTLLRDATDRQLAGDILQCYGLILRGLGCFSDALAQYRITQESYLSASEPQPAALTLLSIARISVFLDPQTEEIPLIEQACLELQRIPSNRRERALSLSSLQKWFKKTFYFDKDSNVMDNGEMAQCLQSLAAAYLHHSRHSEAIQHLIQARGLCPNVSFAAAQCAQALAFTYHHLQQHDEAEEWCLLALKEWSEMGNDDLGYILWLLGMISISKGLYDHAIECLKQTLDIAKGRNDQWGSATGLLELGCAYMKKGDVNNARASFMQALIHFGPLQGVGEEMVVCQFYLEKLKDPLTVPNEEQRHALDVTWHEEDILC